MLISVVSLLLMHRDKCFFGESGCTVVSLPYTGQKLSQDIHFAVHLKFHGTSGLETQKTSKLFGDAGV